MTPPRPEDNRGRTDPRPCYMDNNAARRRLRPRLWVPTPTKCAEVPAKRPAKPLGVLGHPDRDPARWAFRPAPSNGLAAQPRTQIRDERLVRIRVHIERVATGVVLDDDLARTERAFLLQASRDRERHN